MIDFMEQTLSFPGLGLTLELDRVAFQIGGFAVYWYGIIIALAFVVGIVYVMSRVKSFGLDSDRVFDVLLIAVICGVIGARLYYVVFTWQDYKDNLLDIFNVRRGGLAIYGGIIFGVLGGWLGAKLRKVKFLPMLDLALGGIMLGQAVGRWGNFINIEAFGGNTTLPWGMTSPAIVSYLTANKESLGALGMNIDPTMPVHPTFLYESVWCLLGFLLIAFLTKRRRFDGELSLIYLGWYGLGRFFIEGLRTDSLLMGSVRVSQLVALLCFLFAVVALIAIFSRIRREADPDYLKLYVDTEEGQAVLAGTFYPDKKKDKDSEKDEKDSDSDKKKSDESDEELIEEEDEDAAHQAEEEDLVEEEALGEAAGEKMEETDEEPSDLLPDTAAEEEAVETAEKAAELEEESPDGKAD